MLPFVLYFVTALITGFHVSSLLALTLYGVPLNPLELVSLLGSFCLLMAAFLSLFKPLAAAKLALVASLLIWTFYGPASANLLRAKIHQPTAASANQQQIHARAKSIIK
ncbi:MAG: hypothetical protein WAL56_04870 [Candidatus Sulfotelmatobacter sp.]